MKVENAFKALREVSNSSLSTRKTLLYVEMHNDVFKQLTTDPELDCWIASSKPIIVTRDFMEDLFGCKIFLSDSCSKDTITFVHRSEVLIV